MDCSGVQTLICCCCCHRYSSCRWLRQLQSSLFFCCYSNCLFPETNISHENKAINLKLPSFSQVEPLNADDTQVQGMELVPIIESLLHIIPTSTVRKKFSSKRKRGESLPGMPELL